MPTDPRTYITVHDGMPEHPKVECLTDKAFRCLVDLWCWCSRNQTDGAVTAAVWGKRTTARVRAELLTSGLAEAKDDGAVMMHDYLQHQRSKVEIEDLRAKRIAAGSKGGVAKALASATASAKQGLQQNASKPLAESVSVTEVLVPSTSLPSSPAAQATVRVPSGAFDAFWAAYPTKVGKDKARPAFERAVRRVGAADPITLGAKRLAADPNLPERQFIPHPTTWLNRGGWDDEALPPRSSGAQPQAPDRGRGFWGKPVTS